MHILMQYMVLVLVISKSHNVIMIALLHIACNVISLLYSVCQAFKFITIDSIWIQGNSYALHDDHIMIYCNILRYNMY